KRGSPFLLSVPSSSTPRSGRLEYLGPGRRVGLCCEATRAPSQGPTPHGAARGRPLPFGIGTNAPKRLTCHPPPPPVYPLTPPCFSPSYAPARAAARHTA